MAQTCLLHPLAVLNISDHYSRTTAQISDEAQRLTCHIVGCVIGTKSEAGVELFNSFELVIDGSGVIDIDYFQHKQAHYKSVFREWEVVGWYTAPHTQTHDANHSAIAAQVGNPNIVSLVLDPHTADSDALPFTASSQAGPITVKVASTDAEKIGIDHIARVVPQGGSASMQLTAHLGGVHGAIGKLAEGVQCICGYLQGVKSGAIPKDQALLRQVQSLCNRLRVCKTEDSQEQLLQDYNDVLLAAYLSQITKSCDKANELVEKFNTVHEKHHRHRPF